MAEAASVATGGRRRPILAAVLAVAGFAWPVIATGLAALALVAVAGDHQRIAGLDTAVLPEGWTASSFRSALAGVGLTPAAYAIAVDVFKGAFLGSFFIVAAIAGRRRRFDPGALLVAYFLVAFGGTWEV